MVLTYLHKLDPEIPIDMEKKKRNVMRLVVFFGTKTSDGKATEKPETSWEIRFFVADGTISTTVYERCPQKLFGV